MSDLSKLPADVLTSLRRHVTAALDDATLRQNGTLYDTTLHAYVIPRVTADCPPSREYLGVFDEPETWEERQQFGRDMAARLAACPRGAWAMKRNPRTASPGMHSMMSAGGSARSGHSDYFETVPEWQRVYDRMVGYEAYTMRNLIEAERAEAADVAALNANGWAIGQKLPALKLVYDYHIVTFTRATVEAIDGAKVRLALTRRGSKRAYKATLGAARLAHVIAQGVSP